MYEDKVKKSLRKIIIFAVIIGIFLASIGAGFFYVIRTAFDRSTDERMIEETEFSNVKYCRKHYWKF